MSLAALWRGCALCYAYAVRDMATHADSTVRCAGLSAPLTNRVAAVPMAPLLACPAPSRTLSRCVASWMPCTAPRLLNVVRRQWYLHTYAVQYPTTPSVPRRSGWRDWTIVKFVGESSTWYYFMYFVFSVLGLFVHPFFFYFHLSDIVIRVRLLQYVLRSVITNIGQVRGGTIRYDKSLHRLRFVCTFVTRFLAQRYLEPWSLLASGWSVGSPTVVSTAPPTGWSCTTTACLSSSWTTLTMDSEVPQCFKGHQVRLCSCVVLRV